jgi:hypothetical protein
MQPDRSTLAACSEHAHSTRTDHFGQMTHTAHRPLLQPHNPPQLLLQMLTVDDHTTWEAKQAMCSF